MVVWLLLGGACFQLAFQTPYVILIPGERANLFSAILCAIMLILARVYAGSRGLSVNLRESLIALVLCFLVLMSALFSVDVQTSAIRGFVLVASGLGGYFCARFILNTTHGQSFFLWLCAAILTGIVLFSLSNYAFWGDIGQTGSRKMNRHVINNLILILSFSPLTLVYRYSGYLRIFGILLLCAGYLVFFLSGERSAVLIPLGLTVMVCLVKGVRLKHALSAVVLMAAASILLYANIPSYQLRSDYWRVFFRIESYPFSWHIAKKHPWLGAGLLASQEKYLEDYAVNWPHIDKDQFLRVVRRCLTPENIILTFMSQLGFPFTLIYLGSVMFLISRLLALAAKREPETIIPPLALLLPLSGALVQNLIFDGLLYPQLCWFFHLLLGLIPGKPEARYNM